MTEEFSKKSLEYYNKLHVLLSLFRFFFLFYRGKFIILSSSFF